MEAEKIGRPSGKAAEILKISGEAGCTIVTCTVNCGVQKVVILNDSNIIYFYKGKKCSRNWKF